KDRVVSMAATAAKGLGYSKIAAASTGNMANSVAAHAARVGIPSFVFIPSDLEPGKVVQSAVYGQTLVAVDGSYDDVNRLTRGAAGAGEGARVRVLRPDAGRRRGLLRRRQPADQRARRDRRVRGHRVRQPERPAVLRRGLQDHGLRDRRAARLGDPGAGRPPPGPAC